MSKSLPLRKCGLKFLLIYLVPFLLPVTSLAEVWIEISVLDVKQREMPVTSLAEVWIEIHG
mgnify:CR=1 FL=1